MILYSPRPSPVASGTLIKSSINNNTILKQQLQLSGVLGSIVYNNLCYIQLTLLKTFIYSFLPWTFYCVCF